MHRVTGSRRALLRGGESSKTVSTHLRYSGHGFTLRTYVHLMSNTVDRRRRVIDQALDPSRPHDGPDTALHTG